MEPQSPPRTKEERVAGSPQSVTRVIRILEALCANPKPMSLAELSRALDAPKSLTASTGRAVEASSAADRSNASAIAY